MENVNYEKKNYRWFSKTSYTQINWSFHLNCHNFFSALRLLTTSTLCPIPLTTKHLCFIRSDTAVLLCLSLRQPTSQQLSPLLCFLNLYSGLCEPGQVEEFSARYPKQRRQIWTISHGILWDRTLPRPSQGRHTVPDPYGCLAFITSEFLLHCKNKLKYANKYTLT